MKKIIILIILILLLCGCAEVSFCVDYYEYEDLQGNKGIADYCWTVKGNLLCDLEDGTKLSVQSYKGVCKD